MKSFLKRYRRPRALGTTLFLLCIVLHTSQPALAQPAPLRRVNPSAISAQVYQQLPDLPLENQYISSDTGDTATDNTLVSRFIRYHLYIKNRPTNFRLDWKLTLADYLGAFERISPDRYADYGLRENPLASDIAAIEALSPSQRNAFINTLYETFTVPADSSESSSESLPVQ